MHIKLGPVDAFGGNDLYADEKLPTFAARRYRFTDDDGVLFRWCRCDVRLFGYVVIVEARRKPVLPPIVGVTQ